MKNYPVMITTRAEVESKRFDIPIKNGSIKAEIPVRIIKEREIVPYTETKK